MCRLSTFATVTLFVLLVPLVACGGASRPTQPKRPEDLRPDPTAVAAGAPLRATLLAQLDEYERDWCPTAMKFANGECRVAHERPGFRERFPELWSYTDWVFWTLHCFYDPGRGSYAAQAGGCCPGLSAMREPWRLDAYVSGLEWCGHRRPDR